MPLTSLRIKRGTRAQLNAAASGGQLAAGELYLITDENLLAVGISASAYQAAAREGESGAGGSASGSVPVTASLPAPVPWQVVLAAMPATNVELTPAAMLSNPSLNGSLAFSSSQYEGNSTARYCIGSGHANNGWLSAPVAGPHWVEYRAPAGVRLTPNAYVIRPWDVDNFPARTPKTWELQGSDDGESWTTLDARTNYTAWTSGQNQVFPIPNPQTFSRFRLYITANVGGNAYTGMRRFFLLGDQEQLYAVLPSGQVQLITWAV